MGKDIQQLIVLCVYHLAHFPSFQISGYLCENAFSMYTKVTDNKAEQD